MHWRFMPWESYASILQTVSDRTAALYAVFWKDSGCLRKKKPPIFSQQAGIHMYYHNS